MAAKSLTIRHEISGEPIVIDNPLKAEHVKVGLLIWYFGFTATSGWDCPAVITRVSADGKQFMVRSLDDGKEQDVWYDSTRTRHSSSARATMRLASKEEVVKYLDAHKICLDQYVEQAKTYLASAEARVTSFNSVRAELGL